MGEKSFMKSECRTDEDLLWRGNVKQQWAPCLKLAVPRFGCMKSKIEERCEWLRRAS